MADEEDKDYEVGYKKPPKHTQFQPGQSGNPAGRPPRSRNLKRLVDEVLDERVELKENGSALIVSKREALIRRMYFDAMNGDARARRQLIQILEKWSGAFDR